MALRHFLSAMTAAALVCGSACAADIAPAGGEVASARNFLTESLKYRRGEDLYFFWPEKGASGQSYTANAPLREVRITATVVTFVTDPAFEFEFPLKDLKLSSGSDAGLHWGGPMELRITSSPSRLLPAGRATKGEFLIGLPASVSSSMANKIAADFAILSQAAPAR